MERNVYRFKNVASTQDTAKRFVQRGEEIVVVAQQQRRGRGRHGREWSSPKGGLYVSFVLFPRVRINVIPLCAASTIIQILEDYSLSSISLHWPNDILLNKKKVCGVICEQYRGSVICGIGLNVNTTHFPGDLNNATSMKIESRSTYDIEEVFTRMCSLFYRSYSDLQRKGIKVSKIMRYVTGVGEVVEVITKDHTYTATICDVNDDWSLLVRDSSGMTRTLYYGDIRRLIW